MHIRLQVDVIGIFRFLTIVSGTNTVSEILDKAQSDFRQTYDLSISPRFLRLQNDSGEEIVASTTAGESLQDNMRVFAVPDATFCDTLKKTPWQILGIDEQEFEVRLELLRRVFGEEANTAVLRSCLVRAGGQLSKAVAVAGYIRPDVLGTSKKLIFVRPRHDK